MTQNERSQQPVEYERRLPPERWELIRHDAMMRAQQARSETLRQLPRWIVTQAAAAVRYLVDRYRAWLQRQAAVTELQNLDDRSLRDIGVGRSEIQSVVAGWDATRIPRGADYHKRRVLPRSAAKPARPAITKQAA